MAKVTKTFEELAKDYKRLCYECHETTRYNLFQVDEILKVMTALTNYDKMISSIKKHIKNLKAQRDELDKERDPILRDDVTIFILNSKIKLLADLLKEGTKNG